MLMSNRIVLATCLVLAGSSLLRADPVDNPGDARFFNDTGAYPFLRFASTEWIDGSTEEFEAYVDSTGDVYFNGATMPFTLTAQDLGSAGGAPLEVQLFISDVVGIVDLSSGTYFDWEITAQARFRSIGAGGVTSANCRTGSFTIYVDGDWFNHAVSSSFTIPALSGAGTGACNGHSTEINLDFALGSSGALIDIHKWAGENISTGNPLTGS